MGQNYKLSDCNRIPVISETWNEPILLNDGTKVFIREPSEHLSDTYRYITGGRNIGKSECLKLMKESYELDNARKTDFSHLNINKMKMEQLNKANELNGKIANLKDHRKRCEINFMEHCKEPKFNLMVADTGLIIRSEFIPKGFAKQVLSNIDKEIKSLERQIEKL